MYASQPGGGAPERRPLGHRAPPGGGRAATARRTVSRDEVRLDRVDPEQLAAEALAAGLELEEVRHVGETEEHVAAEVVVLRA